MNTKNRAIKAIEVAKWFIAKSNIENKAITNLKVQKLLYYAQVWHLVFFKSKLFNESIEAWVHGPAVPSVYREFKSYGFECIDMKVDQEALDFSSKQVKLFQEIWRVYGKHDGRFLETLTHSEPPWQKAREGYDNGEFCQTNIDLDLARDYYAGKLQTAKS